jgi:hypothetical protein
MSVTSSSRDSCAGTCSRRRTATARPPADRRVDAEARLERSICLMTRDRPMARSMGPEPLIVASCRVVAGSQHEERAVRGQEQEPPPQGRPPSRCPACRAAPTGQPRAGHGARQAGGVRCHQVGEVLPRQGAYPVTARAAPPSPRRRTAVTPVVVRQQGSATSLVAAERTAGARRRAGARPVAVCDHAATRHPLLGRSGRVRCPAAVQKTGSGRGKLRADWATLVRSCWWHRASGGAPPPGSGQKMRDARWQRLPPWLPSTGRQ